MSPLVSVKITTPAQTAQTGGTIPAQVKSANVTKPSTVGVTLNPASGYVLPPSVGSVSRYSVIAFGAVGDGSTDDTTAIQNAINTISAAGGGVLTFPPGYNFAFSSITPASNVICWGYGARITQKSMASPTGSFYRSAAAGAISNFGLFGFSFTGTRTTTDQPVVQIRNSTDIIVRDLHVVNSLAAPIALFDCQRVWVDGCDLQNVCNTTGTGAPYDWNAIDLGSASTGTGFGSNDMFVANNYVDQCPTECINVVCTPSAPNVPSRVIIANNDVQASTSSGACAAIMVELDLPGRNSEILITGNRARYTGTVVGNAAILVSKVASGADTFGQTANSKILIANNIVTSTGQGITCYAAFATISNNIVEIASTGNAGIVFNSHNLAVTGDVTNGSNQILNVSGTNASTIENESLIDQTGVFPRGTYLVSGAGTTTWTVSQNALLTQVGQALTAYYESPHVQISNNIIHMAVSTPLYGMSIDSVIHGEISGNHVVYDTGGSSSSAWGFTITRCGWMIIRDNVIEHAPGHGMLITVSHDFWVTGNRVYNPSEAGGSSKGIWLENVLGVTNTIEDNLVVDDRGTHLMAFGIFNDGTNGPIYLARNVISGAVSAPTGGTWTSTSDNRFTAGAAISGRATLVAGTVTVSTAEIRASDNVLLSVVTPGGTRGEVQLGTITAGTSFVINSIQPGTTSTVQTLDTSVVYWRIDH